MLDDRTENVDATTENSIIKIERKKPEHEAMPDVESKDDPDIYDVNVLAWDAPVSALHLAIANGHPEVAKVLVQEFGADILLPIKLVSERSKSARAAIVPLVLALQLSPEKAKEMTKVLISLGASPAQADVGHVTALHYFTTHGVDVLSAMISADRPAAQRAVGHLSMSDYQYNPIAKSAIQSAIEHKDAASVDALLELGSKPQVDFATYMTSYKSKWVPRETTAHNENQFRNNYQQPVFTAVHCEVPSMVIKLLDAGAEVNSLNAEAWKAISMSRLYSNNGMTHSLLDAVRAKIEQLRAFILTGKTEGDRHRIDYGQQFPPVQVQADANYLQGHDPESYAYWSTSKQLQQARVEYERNLKTYEEWKRSRKEPNGTAEKKSAVTSLLADFEALENEIVKRDGKTFKELHPSVKLREQQRYDYHGYQPQPPQPWEPRLNFQLPDLTDVRRAGYLKLFQACWDADLPTVKELTLAVWGEKESPLKIAVQDFSNFSPFSIAVLRNHRDVAKAVLEIAHAQWAPEVKVGQTKHSVQQASEDDSSSDGHEDAIHIYSEIVDDRFTVENIGEVQSQVKSNVTPLQLISWPCPVSRFFEDDDVATTTKTRFFGASASFYTRYGRNYSRRTRGPRRILKDAANGRTYHVESAPTQEHLEEVIKPGNLFQLAVYLDDLELLHFLITMGEDCTLQKADTDDATSTFFHFDEQDFLYAIQLGRVQLLKEIIERTGAGIPLDDLVKKSGVEVPEKPKYYQGLSVHGKKRADWASAGRDMQCEPEGEKHPPLLHAARLASQDSVKWFLGETALHCYSEFADNHRDDVQIQHLSMAKGGLEASITKWLNLRSHLLIHCVVLGKTNEDSLQLLRYLCKTHPESIYHRSASGLTPLQLAFSLHRTEMIHVLLEAGADQTCRNNVGNNIVHSILSSTFTSIEKDLPRIRDLFSLIDPRLLVSLFTERTTALPGAATPLACWLYTSFQHHNTETPWSDGREALVHTILEFSRGEDLGLVNSEGDTPLHAAVRYGADAVLRTMLEYRPELLFRENATGRTPYEMAENAYLSREVFSDPPSLSVSPGKQNAGSRRSRFHRSGQYDDTSVLNKQPQSFVEDLKDERTGTEKVWQICQNFAHTARDTKRKLVSLVEANEVAKRLASRKGARGEVRAELDTEKKEQDGKGVKGDEVDVWFEMGLQADRT
jgi:ankyrin repeat protein